MTSKETILIDPQVLFQRLMLVAANENLNTEDMFRYELCTYPTALFDSPCAPIMANKAAFAESLWNQVKLVTQGPPLHPIYVLDGGACFIAYLGLEMRLVKIYVMATSAMLVASMANVLSCLMATPMARLLRI